MSAQPDYVIVSQVYENKWHAATQTVTPGWTVTVHDNVTGTIVPVFVPENKYTADNVRLLVDSALTSVRDVARLGQSSAGA